MFALGVVRFVESSGLVHSVERSDVSRRRNCYSVANRRRFLPQLRHCLQDFVVLRWALEDGREFLTLLRVQRLRTHNPCGQRIDLRRWCKRQFVAIAGRHCFRHTGAAQCCSYLLDRFERLWV
jgi:hypothetical protein